MSADFLVEIGTEELPPKALAGLAAAFRDELLARLGEADLAHGDARFFATPRRLAVLIAGLADRAPARETVVWGPPAKVAFDSEGKPTRAAEAFAGKQGLALDSLPDQVENDGKQDKLCHRQMVEGCVTAEVIDRIVHAALKALPIPKRMRWGERREEFVRPVHWVVMLHGENVVGDNILGLQPGRDTRGHRFHSEGTVALASPADYVETLRSRYVMADFDERRRFIAEGVRRVAGDAGGSAVIDDELLDEVTALNEWPVPLAGRFDERFLEVPEEALVSSMKEHQKYFHAVDDNGRLLPIFITVANIDSVEPAQVIAGNERVIRPRLADAAFFYETDRKTPLANRREELKRIVFQEKLGTLFDKTERVAELAACLSDVLGADTEHARRAGQLSKTDLVTEMVLEFDDLQGIMGRYYARHDGEAEDVARAMYEQYLPAFAGDSLPETATGTAVALADRLDTLVGIFGIGQPPSGSRDPFALRRASLGVLRILVEKELDLDLAPVLAKATALHTGLTAGDDNEKRVLTYIIERFRAWYEEEDIPVEVFMAVNAKAISNPLDFHQRSLAVQQFHHLPEGAALAAANKRVSNILAKAAEPIPDQVDSGRLREDAEQALFRALNSVATEVEPLLMARDYTAAMGRMAALKAPVDAFFDEVMVMAEDPALRANRLCLLSQLRALFLNVADISLLVPGK
jgi:glycyl-tRNA synthetase beta chain